MPQFFQTIYSNKTLSLLLVAWTIMWKGLALWRAAKKDQRIWFIAILIISSLGLLEITYLFILPKIPQWLPKEKANTLPVRKR